MTGALTGSMTGSVTASPAHLDGWATIVDDAVVAIDTVAAPDAVEAFLADPDNDIGDGGVASLAGRVEESLAEVARITAACRMFAEALAAADQDARWGGPRPLVPLGTTDVTTLDQPVTMTLDAADWATWQTSLAILDAHALLGEVRDRHHARDRAAADQALLDIRATMRGGLAGIRQPQLAAIRTTLAGLDPRALDLVVADMADDELRDLFDQLSQPAALGGLTREERSAFLLTIGMAASPDTWRRLADFTDEIDPPVVGRVARRARMLPDQVRNGAQWRRRHDDMMVGGPQAHDVRQSLLGDCWLIAGIQGIAMKAPALLEDVVRPTGNGLFVVRFADGHEEVVGPDFPATPNGLPAFAQPDAADPTPELWGMLIEKAWAQRDGGWQAIESRRPVQAVEGLVGLPSEHHDPADFEFDELADWFEAGDIISVGTIDPPPRDDMDDAEWDRFVEEWRETDAPERFRNDLPSGSRPADSVLHPNHGGIVVAVDRRSRTVTINEPTNPSTARIAMTFDQLVDSSDFIGVNRVP